MTHTLTRHKITKPTLSSSSPRQCSECHRSASRSSTQDVPSVVPAISTRCLTLRPVAPCPSKALSDLPHSLPSEANSDLLDSTPSSYPAPDAHLALPVLRWWQHRCPECRCLHRWRLLNVLSRLRPPCPQAHSSTRSGGRPWYRQGGYLRAGVYLTPATGKLAGHKL